jgi:putative membrane protein
MPVCDMGDAMAGMGPWMMMLWSLLGLIVLGLAVAGGVWLARALIQGRSGGQGEIEGPREVLQRRYAAGEIGEDEYFRRLSGLDQP